MIPKPEKPVVKARDKITPMDILLFIILVITIILTILTLVVEPYYIEEANDNNSDASGSNSTQTKTNEKIDGTRLAAAILCVLGFACILTSTILHSILFCTCEKKRREMTISLIVLVWFAFLFFAIAAAVSYRQIPNDGAWLISAACTTLVSTIIAVFLFVEEQHIDRNTL